MMTGLARAIRYLHLAAGADLDRRRSVYRRYVRRFKPTPEDIDWAVYRARNRLDSLGGRSVLEYLTGP